MLEMKNIRKSYHKQVVLDGFQLDISAGSCFGLVGRDGAGKTTAIKIMTGLLKSDSGQIYINDRNIVQDSNYLKQEIGYVPDYFGLYENLKVSEYMEFFAACYGLDGLAARKKCDLLLDQVGLEEQKDFYADSLSKGMKQRLNLARALIHDPSILILDEPVAGLDPMTGSELKQVLKELHEQGKTIIISSHILSELSEVCTDIGIMEHGKMVLRGNVRQMLSQVYTSSPLMISVYEQEKMAVDLLRKHSLVSTVSIKGKEMRVVFKGEQEDEVMLLYQMIQAGIPIYSFYRQTSSIESLFIEMTKQEDVKVVLSNDN